MFFLRPLLAALLLALPAAAQEEIDPAVTVMVDTLFRDRIETFIEGFYWAQTEDLLAKYEVTPTNEELAVMHEAARPVVPGSYDYAIPPVYDLAEKTVTPQQAGRIETALMEGGREAVTDPELKEAMQSIIDGANGMMAETIGPLVYARLGNYRFDAWKAGEEAGFIPEGLPGTR